MARADPVEPVDLAGPERIVEQVLPQLRSVKNAGANYLNGPKSYWSS
jgi:hypothetical protein